MPFKFEKLEIWQLAIEYADDVHTLTRKFPKEEIFSLTAQFKKAADSISLNISEGSIDQTNKEQRRFLGYSIRSLAECVNCLYLSIRRGYISKAEFDTQYRKSEILIAKTITFKKGVGTEDRGRMTND